MEKYKSFLIRLVGMSFIVEIIALGWSFAMPREWVSPALPYLPPFFMAVTIIIHKYFVSAVGKNPRQFVTSYMLITMLKLFSFLAILVVYGFLKTHDAVQFTLSFLVLYVVYSAFEAVAVIKLNRNTDTN